MGLRPGRRALAQWSVDEDGRPVLHLRISSWPVALRVLHALRDLLATEG